MTDDEFIARFDSVTDLLGDVPVEVLVALAAFPTLAYDQEHRHHFRERLYFMARCLRQTPTTLDEVAWTNAIGESMFGSPARTADDVLSESRVDIAAANAAEALARAFA